MKRKEYEEIALYQAHQLEMRTGQRVAEGAEGVCPYCGRPGKFSLGVGYTAGENDIYWSAVHNEWRCITDEYTHGVK
jgi:hypothetical protein